MLRWLLSKLCWWCKRPYLTKDDLPDYVRLTFGEFSRNKWDFINGIRSDD